MHAWHRQVDARLLLVDLKFTVQLALGRYKGCLNLMGELVNVLSIDECLPPIQIQLWPSQSKFLLTDEAFRYERLLPPMLLNLAATRIIHHVPLAHRGRQDRLHLLLALHEVSVQ